MNPRNIPFLIVAFLLLSFTTPNVSLSSVAAEEEPPAEFEYSMLISLPDGSTEWFTGAIGSNHTAWNASVEAFDSAGVDYETTTYEWGIFLDSVSGHTSPSDWSWWWGFYLWNETTEVWDTASVGASSYIIDSNLTFAWHPSFAGRPIGPGVEPGGEYIYQTLISFPDGEVAWTQGATEGGATLWNVSLDAFDDMGFDENHTDGQWGVMLNSINGSQSPADWSWWWGFYYWSWVDNGWVPFSTGASGVNLTQNLIFAWHATYANGMLGPSVTPLQRSPIISNFSVGIALPQELGTTLILSEIHTTHAYNALSAIQAWTMVESALMSYDIESRGLSFTAAGGVNLSSVESWNVLRWNGSDWNLETNGLNTFAFDNDEMVLLTPSSVETSQLPPRTDLLSSCGSKEVVWLSQIAPTLTLNVTTFQLSSGGEVTVTGHVTHADLDSCSMSMLTNDGAIHNGVIDENGFLTLTLSPQDIVSTGEVVVTCGVDELNVTSQVGFAVAMPSDVKNDSGVPGFTIVLTTLALLVAATTMIRRKK